MPGGRIAPDGRPAQAPGVGRNAKRHDLERPKTPGLHDSDLQQGDVQALEQGQRIVPVTRQQPARPQPKGGTQRRTQARPQASGDTPDPIDFLGQRLKGSLASPPLIPRSDAGASGHQWLPLLQRLATAPGASGLLAQAYITQLSNALNRPLTHEIRLIDMQQADLDAEAYWSEG